jgi:hypothetical protein
MFMLTEYGEESVEYANLCNTFITSGKSHTKNALVSFGEGQEEIKSRFSPLYYTRPRFSSLKIFFENILL